MKIKEINQKGIGSTLILVAAVGLVGFLLLSNSLDFKDKLFSGLYPKQKSFAAGQTVADEILVKFDKGVSFSDRDKIRTQFGEANILSITPDIDVERWKVDINKRDEILDKLNNNPYILFAEPNYLLVGGNTAADIAQAIINTVNKKISTISINLTSEYSNTIQAAINFASNKGVVVEKVQK